MWKVVEGLYYIAGFFVFALLCSVSQSCRRRNRGRNQRKTVDGENRSDGYKKISIDDIYLDQITLEEKKYQSKLTKFQDKLEAIRESKELLTSRIHTARIEERDYESQVDVMKDQRGREIYGDAWDNGVEGGPPLRVLFSLSESEVKSIKKTAKFTAGSAVCSSIQQKDKKPKTVVKNGINLPLLDLKGAGISMGTPRVGRLSSHSHTAIHDNSQTLPLDPSHDLHDTVISSSDDEVYTREQLLLAHHDSHPNTSSSFLSLRSNAATHSSGKFNNNKGRKPTSRRNPRVMLGAISPLSRTPKTNYGRNTSPPTQQWSSTRRNSNNNNNNNTYSEFVVKSSDGGGYALDNNSYKHARDLSSSFVSTRSRTSIHSEVDEPQQHNLP